MDLNTPAEPPVHFRFDEGILVVVYRYNLCIDLKTAEEIVAKRLEISGDKAYPVLIIDEGVKSIEKSARDYFSSPAGIRNITASALVLQSLYSMVLGNFLIQITKPPIPVKIFRDINKAKKWLKAYRT